MLAPVLQTIERGAGVPPVIVKSIDPSLPPAQVAATVEADSTGAVQEGALSAGFVSVLWKVEEPTQPTTVALGIQIPVFEQVVPS